MVNASSTASSSSSSSSREVGDAEDSSLQPLMMGETCMYYSRNRMSGCRWARTCQSCLSSAGCMINGAGWCVDQDQEAFVPEKDFEIAIKEGLSLPDPTANASLQAVDQVWQFRAGEAKYCTPDDKTCRRCVQNNFWRARNSYPDSHFCVGEGGCVCIDACERRWYVQNDCPSKAVSSPSPSPTPMVTAQSTYYLTNSNVADRIWRGMVGAIVFALLFLIVVIRQRKKAEARERAEQDERRRRQEARLQRRHDRAESLGVNPLNLTGWETYRRDLIEKEKAHLAGTGLATTRTTSGDAESSSDESSEDEIISPRVQGHGSAVYVRVEDDAERSTSINTAGTNEMAHGSVAPIAQRDSLPSLQVTPPIPRGA